MIEIYAGNTLIQTIKKVKSKLVCNFPRSSVNPLTHPHVNIRVTITVKIPNV